MTWPYHIFADLYHHVAAVNDLFKIASAYFIGQPFNDLVLVSDVKDTVIGKAKRVTYKDGDTEIGRASCRERV